MIVVKLELWPGGDESRAVDLGKAEIANVSGLADLSAYEVRLLKGARYSNRPGELYRRGLVAMFPRRDTRWGPWELLALALEATVGPRIAALRKFIERACATCPECRVNLSKHSHKLSCSQRTSKGLRFNASRSDDAPALQAEPGKEGA